MDNNTTYSWIFHQRLDGVWESVKREHYHEIWNGNRQHVLSSSNLDTLIEIVRKTDGDPDKINQLINGDLVEDERYD